MNKKKTTRREIGARQGWMRRQYSHVLIIIKIQEHLDDDPVHDNGRLGGNEESRRSHDYYCLLKSVPIRIHSSVDTNIRYMKTDDPDEMEKVVEATIIIIACWNLCRLEDIIRWTQTIGGNGGGGTVGEKVKFVS